MLRAPHGVWRSARRSCGPLSTIEDGTGVPGTLRRWLRVGDGSPAQEGEIDPSIAPAQRGTGTAVGVCARGGTPDPRGVDSLDGGPPSISGGSFLDNTN